MEENNFKSYLLIDKIEAYNKALTFSNLLWDEVIRFDYFEKNSVGLQLVRAADSVSANIADGFGRYHKKDKIKFYQYAKGSALECYDWLLKCKHRKLLNDSQLQSYIETVQNLPKSINYLIKYTNDNLKE
ncbi:MAG: four helix bundle protein [Bacteroidota bacterium]|jgi:four helix bundle protein